MEKFYKTEKYVSDLEKKYGNNISVDRFFYELSCIYLIVFKGTLKRIHYIKEYSKLNKKIFELLFDKHTSIELYVEPTSEKDYDYFIQRKEEYEKKHNYYPPLTFLELEKMLKSYEVKIKRKSFNYCGQYELDFNECSELRDQCYDELYETVFIKKIDIVSNDGKMNFKCLIEKEYADFFDRKYLIDTFKDIEVYDSFS